VNIQSGIWGCQLCENDISLKLDIASARYQAMIGTGGIGSGVFFALEGDHTLGREESRIGRFLDKRDYCKLHIISHYVKVLLGSDFQTILVGKVGDDEVGHRLLAEMRDTHLDLRYVTTTPGEQTLFSTCFVYPDGSGGNLTTANSASARVDATYVSDVQSIFRQYQNCGVALAAPEVPLNARKKLLKLGRQFGFFTAASLNSSEAQTPEAVQILENTDLLAVNLDEASALTGSDLLQKDSESVFDAAVKKLRQIQPDISVAVTAGKLGSWVWDGKVRCKLRALETPIASTAGAGDAFLAGLIVGRVAGLAMTDSQYLATLVAGLSVTSPHTIHPGLNRQTLRSFANEMGAWLPDSVKTLLKDD
jgi:sugar/nucleoside kinase (ribokinase family)